jgi:hypothetical protein
MVSKSRCLYIIHRVNSINKLKSIPPEFGIEIDVRGFGDKILLNHDPLDSYSQYEELDNFLSYFHHAFVVFNIKEAGYEDRVIDIAVSHGIQHYFLLDVEFPYFYRATRMNHFRNIAARFSEAEPIEFIFSQRDGERFLVDWVWVDTNTRLPLTKEICSQLRGLKICLVSPDRWGRPGEIASYAQYMSQHQIHVQAIMTELQYVPIWKQSYG